MISCHRGMYDEIVFTFFSVKTLFKISTKEAFPCSGQHPTVNCECSIGIFNCCGRCGIESLSTMRDGMKYLNI